jgi:Cys-rich repeat protein
MRRVAFIGAAIGALLTSCSSGETHIPGYGADCTSDSDCAQYQLMCDGQIGCVQCLSNADCASGTCMSGVCRGSGTSSGGSSSGGTGGTEGMCTQSIQCPLNQVCDPATSTCVACVSDADCASGQTCISSHCFVSGAGTGGTATGGTGGTATGGTGGTTTGGTGGTTGGTGGTGPRPCEGLCTDPVVFVGPSYTSPQLGAGEGCYETLGSLSGFDCYDFTGARTFAVNGQTVPCGASASVPASTNGGYCFVYTAGQHDYATFATW